MRHNVFGKTLNRDTGQRQALLKGLAGAIIRSEAIETTEAKAKAAKGLIEQLVTQAKRATLTDIRQIESVILNKELVNKLVHDIAVRFKTRSGGYLRLIKIGARVGDNAPMVRMEFVSKADSTAPVVSPKSSTTVKPTASTSRSKSRTKSTK
jgi:large subunit ribosomal protein L17